MTRHEWLVVGVLFAALVFYVIVATVGIALAKRAAKNLDAWESRRVARETEKRIQAERAAIARMRQAAIDAHNSH